jgi:predicted outer membrane repeat protein
VNGQGRERESGRAAPGENGAAGLLQIYNSGFTNNWAGSSGGAIYSKDNSLQITNSSFVGNNSTNNTAGAIYHTKAGATKRGKDLKKKFPSGGYSITDWSLYE